MRKWTKEEEELLRLYYPNSKPSKLSELLPGRTAIAIHNRACILKLRKSEEYFENEENPGRFKKGHKTWTKGKKWVDYMPASSVERCRTTQFKKGNKPCTYLPIGTEIESSGYVYVKVSDVPNVPKYVNWKLKHRMLWESVNGSIPEGCNIQFKDGNTKNIVIDNLYMISRQEQMKVNGIMNVPEDTRRLMYAIRSLTRAINTREKYEQKH